MGEEAITKAVFDAWFAIASRDSVSRSATRDQVMVFLLEATWTRQETAARGLSVTPRRVRRRFEQQKRADFESERAYRRYLRRSGMTEAHFLQRIEIDLLSQRLAAEEGCRGSSGCSPGS